MVRRFPNAEEQHAVQGEAIVRQMEKILERPLTAEEVRLVLLAATVRCDMESRSEAA